MIEKLDNYKGATGFQVLIGRLVTEELRVKLINNDGSFKSL